MNIEAAFILCKRIFEIWFLTFGKMHCLKNSLSDVFQICDILAQESGKLTRVLGKTDVFYI